MEKNLENSYDLIIHRSEFGKIMINYIAPKFNSSLPFFIPHFSMSHFVIDY